MQRQTLSGQVSQNPNKQDSLFGNRAVLCLVARLPYKYGVHGNAPFLMRIDAVVSSNAQFEVGRALCQGK